MLKLIRAEDILTGRRELVERIRELPCDMLIVGGGITGACIARDAAMRGINVVLVDKNDFAWGTSSRSSKLIHGGFRYLEQMDFRLVFESTQERAILSRIAPHLVTPCPFLFPSYRGDKYGPTMVGLGMWLYDVLATFRAYRRHEMLSREDIEERVPYLDRRGLTGGALYYDAMTHDAFLTVSMIEDAVKHGAFCVNYMGYEGAVYRAGKVVGARLRDGETNELFTINTPWIVHAAGAYTDDVQARAGLVGSPMVRPTKGVHIAVSRDKLPLEAALVMNSRRDHRVTFALPWGDVTVIGTTDTDHGGSIYNVHADKNDVDYLLDVTRTYFPTIDIGYDEIISTWAGLRPLLRTDQKFSYKVSREHAIMMDPSGVLTICGGKLTTCRKMAMDVVDSYLNHQPREVQSNIRSCATDEVPIVGGEGLSSFEDLERLIDQLAEQYEISARQAEHFARTYGSRAVKFLDDEISVDGGMEVLVPGLPYVVGEIDLAVHRLFARRTSDILIRRLPIFYKAVDQGLGIAPKVAKRIGELLGRDEATTEEDLDEYRKNVADSRGWWSELDEAS